jgi:hypothetical protein
MLRSAGTVAEPGGPRVMTAPTSQKRTVEDSGEV